MARKDDYLNICVPKTSQGNGGHDSPAEGSNLADQEGRTALMLCACHEMWDLATKLIRNYSADPFLVDKNGRSFFYLMKQRGLLGWVQDHFSAWAKNKTYILKAALMMNYTNLLTLALEQNKITTTELQKLALQIRAYPYIITNLNQLANLNTTHKGNNPNQNHLLHILLDRSGGKPQEIQQIMTKNPIKDQINVRDGHDRTVFELILRKRWWKPWLGVVELLCQNGGDPLITGSCGMNGFEMALNVGAIDVYLCFLRYCDEVPNFQDPSTGNTILHLLCAKGAGYRERDEKIVHMILLEANVLIKNKKGIRVFEVVREAIEDYVSIKFWIDQLLYRTTAFSDYSKEQLHETCVGETEKFWETEVMQTKKFGDRHKDLIGIPEITPNLLLSSWIGSTSDWFHVQMLIRIYYVSSISLTLFRNIVEYWNDTSLRNPFRRLRKNF
eukprot:CAMPEP_0114988740 /NCGR_PEP_ID=MMETSP0216-20121206/9779_1 /TAXON_ID=223996 /ORGANISM="Protocruzia adherens, Strain Boccale" /LENGTH=442 /DNA_ID=CAMNT_0002351579 /DNA_START=195 /DNA_END=1520 /DNA_ORIENTATION=+